MKKRFISAIKGLLIVMLILTFSYVVHHIFRVHPVNMWRCGLTYLCLLLGMIGGMPFFIEILDETE